jgi:hypothetical protein
MLPVMSSWETDNGLTQTLNQEAKMYVTMLTNNFTMRIQSWQYRILRAELVNHPQAEHKPLMKFLVLAMARLIADMKESEPARYKDPLV